MDRRLLQIRTFVLHKNVKKEVIIKDIIEGDMTLYFKYVGQDNFNSSYTNLNVIDEYHAEIIMSCPSNQQFHPERAIELGTYLGKYKLSLDYTMLPGSKEDNVRVCRCLFFINE